MSTGLTPCPLQPVDESPVNRRWLGLVVPKRYARRSVTRTLLKRHIRDAVHKASGLDSGMWVVRLRAPFSKAEYPSAASDCLAHAASNELAALMAAAVLPVRRRS